ncbi:MAG: hypothetical protein WCO26_22310, partial [Deltaproteobacteria bacterium]
ELEFASLLDDLFGDGPDALIGAGLVLKRFEPVHAIPSQPVTDRLGLDGGHFSGLEHPGLVGQVFEDEAALTSAGLDTH